MIAGRTSKTPRLLLYSRTLNQSCVPATDATAECTLGVANGGQMNHFLLWVLYRQTLALYIVPPTTKTPSVTGAAPVKEKLMDMEGPGAHSSL